MFSLVKNRYSALQHHADEEPEQTKTTPKTECNSASDQEESEKCNGRTMCDQISPAKENLLGLCKNLEMSYFHAHNTHLSPQISLPKLGCLY